MVGVVSDKMFAMVVACKKEGGRETIVDQWDMDISKAADAVVQTEYVCEELSTKRFEALVYWNLEKEQCFPNVKQVKDCAQKLGISSSWVWLNTIIIQRAQDALQNTGGPSSQYEELYCFFLLLCERSAKRDMRHTAISKNVVKRTANIP